MLRYKSGLPFPGKAFEAPQHASHSALHPMGPAQLFKIATGDFVSQIIALSCTHLQDFKTVSKKLQLAVVFCR